MHEGRNPGRVGVVGTLNVDLVWQVAALPRPGQTVLAHTTERQFGGKGANQAVAAARQGAHVTMLGAVGDDAEGRAYREHLEREGIGVDLLQVVPRVATGTAHVYVEAGGENLIVVDQGANAHLQVRRLAELLPKMDVLLVQLECALPAALEALRLAAGAGVLTVLNASPVNSEFPWGSLPINTVIVNEHECAEVFRLSAEVLVKLTAAQRKEFIGRWRLTHLVVTRGAHTTLHLWEDGIEEVPAHPVVPRDTVGAGDMFAGALAAEIGRGREWSTAISWANVAAALSTLEVGAQAAMPRRDCVEAAIAVTSAR